MTYCCQSDIIICYRAGGSRTHDTELYRPPLSPLSYRPVYDQVRYSYSLFHLNSFPQIKLSKAYLLKPSDGIRTRNHMIPNHAICQLKYTRRNYLNVSPSGLLSLFCKTFLFPPFLFQLPPGFEPGYTDYKSVVLPLDDESIEPIVGLEPMPVIRALPAAYRSGPLLMTIITPYRHVRDKRSACFLLSLIVICFPRTPRIPVKNQRENLFSAVIFTGIQRGGSPPLSQPQERLFVSEAWGSCSAARSGFEPLSPD